MENKSKLNRIFDAIILERAYQDYVWGPLEKQQGRDISNWFDRLTAKIFDAEDRFFREKDVCLEVLKVAAVAIAFLEQQGPDTIDTDMCEHRAEDVEFHATRNKQ